MLRLLKWETLTLCTEMGNAYAMYSTASSYMDGDGVPIDEKKAKIYFEMAVKKGHVESLVSLSKIHDGVNLQVSFGYLRLAAESGHEESMEALKRSYRFHTNASSEHSDNCGCDSCKIINTKGVLTKDDLATTIRAFHSAQEELKSDARDLARENDKAGT